MSAFFVPQVGSPISKTNIIHPHVYVSILLLSDYNLHKNVMLLFQIILWYNFVLNSFLNVIFSKSPGIWFFKICIAGMSQLSLCCLWLWCIVSIIYISIPLYFFFLLMRVPPHSDILFLESGLCDPQNTHHKNLNRLSMDGLTIHKHCVIRNIYFKLRLFPLVYIF